MHLINNDNQIYLHFYIKTNVTNVTNVITSPKINQSGQIINLNFDIFVDSKSQLQMKLLKPLRWNFTLFKEQISEKYGKKCCRYNQDGKPLLHQPATSIFQSLSEFLKGWKLQQNSTRLSKHYYAEDYPMALQFLDEVVKIDANEFKQCPSFSMQNGQVLKLQLYSISLKGLSMIDFQLAMRINNLDPHKYRLLELQNVENYRKQVSKIRMKRQSDRVQKMLDEEMKGWGNKNTNQKKVVQ